MRQELENIEEDLNYVQLSFSRGELRFKDYHASLNALRAREEAAQKALTTLLVPKGQPSDFNALEAWMEGSIELEVTVDHITLLPIGRVGPAKAKAMISMTTEVHWRTSR